MDFRTERFFENTISFVLVTSCSVMFVLVLFWDKGEWVVMSAAFAAAVMGNLQAFVIYPFFNAFYRTSLISSLNLGETATSLVCGSLALAQSPYTGVENFTASQFFGAVLVCSVLASLAWTSLGWQRGYRKHDEETEWELEDGAPVPDGCQLLGDDGEPLVLSETTNADENGSPTGRTGASYGATASGDSRRESPRTAPRLGSPCAGLERDAQMNREVMGSGGAMARGAHGIALPSERDGKAFRSPSYFDVRAARREPGDEENRFGGRRRRRRFRRRRRRRVGRPDVFRVRSRRPVRACRGLVRERTSCGDAEGLGGEVAVAARDPEHADDLVGDLGVYPVFGGGGDGHVRHAKRRGALVHSDVHGFFQHPAHRRPPVCPHGREVVG